MMKLTPAQRAAVYRLAVLRMNNHEAKPYDERDVVPLHPEHLPGCCYHLSHAAAELGFDPGLAYDEMEESFPEFLAQRPAGVGAAYWWPKGMKVPRVEALLRAARLADEALD